MKRVLLTLTLLFFIVPFAIAQDLPSHIPTEGLVAYYPFNGNANDESGNDHHGVVNEATLSDGLRGKKTAYNFGSDSAYISVPSSSQLSLSNVDFTISAFVKLDSYPLSQSDEDFNQYFTILGKRQYARTTRNYSIGISTPNSNIGGLKFTFAQGPRGVGSFVYSDLPIDTSGDWNNLVVVYTQNDSTIKFFVNSELVYKQDGIIIDGENDADLWFGKDVSGYANDFPGKIDDIGIWNRALTEQEIQNLYTSSAGDILLNGTVSAENNQIKNLAAPTNINDAVTLGFLLDKINDLQDQINTLQGSEGGNLTDNEGNSYPYVTYGNQKWTTKNIEITTYTDGTSIPEVTDPNEWANLTTGAWCYKNNDPSTETKFYNWYAVNGVHDDDPNTANKKFAPEGWSVPTKTDWEVLQDFLISSGYNHDGTVTGNKIAKSMSSKTGWNPSENVGAPGNNLSLNNSSNFNAYPHGNRIANGNFGFSSEYATFWSSTESSQDTNKAYLYYLNKNLVGLILPDHDPKNGGFPVRLLKND